MSETTIQEAKKLPMRVLAERELLGGREGQTNIASTTKS